MWRILSPDGAVLQESTTKYSLEVLSYDVTIAEVRRITEGGKGLRKSLLLTPLTPVHRTMAFSSLVRL